MRVLDLDKLLAKLKVPEGRMTGQGGFSDTHWKKIWTKRKAGYSWQQIHEAIQVHVSPGALGQAALKWARETGFDPGTIRQRIPKKRKVYHVSKAAASARAKRGWKTRQQNTGTTTRRKVKRRRKMTTQGRQSLIANLVKAREAKSRKRAALAANGKHSGALIAAGRR